MSKTLIVLLLLLVISTQIQSRQQTVDITQVHNDLSECGKRCIQGANFECANDTQSVVITCVGAFGCPSTDSANINQLLEYNCNPKPQNTPYSDEDQSNSGGGSIKLISFMTLISSLLFV